MGYLVSAAAASALVLLLALFTTSTAVANLPYNISYDDRAFMINGEKKIIISGSIHYPRSTPEMWPRLISRAKEGGLNAIETYVFWNAHEPSPGKYDFSDNLDLMKFINFVHYEKMWVILRIGPYVCAEWNFGGVPVWLHNRPDVTFRTHNDGFEEAMKNFTTYIVTMAKQKEYFASQGGPIILAQIENEYGNVKSDFGCEADSYMNWAANLAESLDTKVPWIMCQESDAPSPMIEACNGFYCDQYKPNNKKVPKLWTENWTGWFNEWGGQHEHRPAEDLAFAVARFFQNGGTLQNYYMYHGGTNFGRSAGGPYITTSYDYDAPLDEYGNYNQPKWGHLQQLHLVLRARENILTQGVVNNVDYGDEMTVTEYTLDGSSVCFFGNGDGSKDATVNYKGINYTTAGWSVVIRDNCTTEVFNTAKVNTQTSVMVKRPVDENPPKLNWRWTDEFIEQFEYPGTRYTYANELLEQKSVTNDHSDYLWYMTSVQGPVPLGSRLTLQVHTGGHVVHLFINRTYIESKWATNGQYSFVFEPTIDLQPGANMISLLSATVGLPNYGAYYDKIQQGIIGPVKLVVPGQEIDLSTNLWAYRVGLNGELRKLYNGELDQQFKNGPLRTERMLTWYKTTFPTPQVDDPIVLDLLGMGKGIAWVNGHNIGRYWPAYVSNKQCYNSCDYRQGYNHKSCQTNCGEPSQRYYHVPKDFLNPDINTLVLFEEIGGNPENITVQSVGIGTVCSDVYEGHQLSLVCDGGRQIVEITFASFGDPQGSCGAFVEGFCGSPNTRQVVSDACLGQQFCLVDLNENTMPTSCQSNVTRRLAVQAVCE